MKRRIVLAALFFLSSMFLLAASTSSKQNSLGVELPNENPNTYYVGSIIGGDILGTDNNNQAISIRVHPKGTFLLFDENKVFCGTRPGLMLMDEHQQIKRGYLAFTYKRQASRLVNDVPCYDLYSVDKLEGK